MNPGPTDFGPNVIIFDPSTPKNTIQQKLDDIFHQQDANQFGQERYAILFKPGLYDVGVRFGYYTTVHGLGHSPDDVTIARGVQALAESTNGMALNNFWRGVENLAMIPPEANINIWAVSQATFMRRCHVKGELWLFNFHFQNAFTSGGFVADTKIDTQVISGSQQQFLTRNSTVPKWIGGVWNMVFVGSEMPPPAPWSDAPNTWPEAPNTTVEATPVLREKPYLVVDGSGNYSVKVPALKKDSKGPSWTGGPDAATTLPINQFYIARADRDTAESLNAALQRGFHLIITPGVYHLARSVDVIYPDTVVLGLGLATLTPDNGTPALTLADVGGVMISGLLLDAGPKPSASLFIAGPSTNNADHSANPTVLHDLSCRVGGSAVASVKNCFTINANNVILDNVWLWRADHDRGDGRDVGWNVNPGDNGITVNGQNVTAYGLFVEHFQGIQTVWNGNGGRLYFYQSEIPYDVPNQGAWHPPNSSGKGCPSYKVSNNVTTHAAEGLGVYCNFLEKDVQLDNAIETPTGPGIQMQHMVTIWLGKASGTSINHIINGRGNAVYDNGQNMKAQLGH